MTCKDLIGYQLVSIDDTRIVVCKDGKSYALDIVDDYGDCCGYNEINTTLLVNEEELHNNPIITGVEMIKDELGECCIGKLSFFGAYKPLAVVDTTSGSGSGWCYGACVSIVCDALKINEVVSEW